MWALRITRVPKTHLESNFDAIFDELFDRVDILRRMWIVWIYGSTDPNQRGGGCVRGGMVMIGQSDRKIKIPERIGVLMGGGWCGGEEAVWAATAIWI